MLIKFVVVSWFYRINDGCGLDGRDLRNQSNELRIFGVFLVSGDIVRRRCSDETYSVIALSAYAFCVRFLVMFNKSLERMTVTVNVQIAQYHRAAPIDCCFKGVGTL